jgi:hypothetical protein
MTEYMEYLHMQKAIPANTIGVPISIDAVDPNGNFVHIGDVTSDESGVFAYAWEPTIAGQYKISATFMGDDSYGSSYANTYATVVDAPNVSPTPTQTANVNDVVGPLSMYIIGIGVAIIIAVAIVGLLVLRKHP